MSLNPCSQQDASLFVTSQCHRVEGKACKSFRLVASPEEKLFYILDGDSKA